MPDATGETLRYIPLLPLLAALVSGLWLWFASRELPRPIVVGLGCGAPLLAFAWTAAEFFVLATTADGPGHHADELYTWISAGDLHAEFALLFDPLSAVMALVVTGVGSLICLYAAAYMARDERPDGGLQRFFVYMDLFLFAMLVLVLADNLLLLFVGWEGVGVCSWLLIGFWHGDDANAAAAQKAFVVNRVGDFFFLVGLFLIFWAYSAAGQPTIGFLEMAEHAPSVAEARLALPAWLGFMDPSGDGTSWIQVACVCLFLGACGKSAQLPLHVWLPDAMAGPTPVSALIHAATMVTAGVYLLCRMSFLYAFAPDAMALVAWTGALTALLGATVAMTQRDLKKILAWSTISQLGYMFLAAGVAAYSAALFHVVTHAFAKALLFLGAGSVILALHHEQDSFRMGGLYRRLPWTHVTFAIGAAAIAGIPPLAGFVSKDQILSGTFAAHGVPGHGALWAVAVATAGLTAFYMMRMYALVFLGESRTPWSVQREIREQPAGILTPLVALALLALLGGLFGLPDLYGEELFGIERSNSLHHFVSGVVPSLVHEVAVGTELTLVGVALLLTAFGAGMGVLLYLLRRDLRRRIARTVLPVGRVVARAYYVDEVYREGIVRPLLRLSRGPLRRGVEERGIDDTLVHGSARALLGLGDRVLKRLQSGLAQSYVFGMIAGALLLVILLLGAAT